ncbi:MAG TPA: sigma 54-interacting transcriptional regulator [Kofleriaceae bacterium]|nr:sigma 54-interacting transcriptional regulator [Kofleriaceae bacterium]
MQTAPLLRDRIQIARFRLRVTSGPDAGRSTESATHEVTIGSGTDQDLQLSDQYVSRHHCVIRVSDDGLVCEDLDSTNGTLVGGIRISKAVISPGDTIIVGETMLAVDLPGDTISETLSRSDRFGRVLGSSVAMRRVFALLEKVTTSDATILIEGETGTGKSALAEAIHLGSHRAGKPFVVVDCGALPRHLLESELFGHERGAFTGAVETRIGLFESAAGGTILLDEIGELPIELQPKLLRALERRRIRRVGSNRELPVDVRLIAATHRDLRRAINQKTFRSDLWFRINTVRVVMPALRERRDDIPMLVASFYRELQDDPTAIPPRALVQTLMRGTWQGNVRELRSAVERSLVGAPPIEDETAAQGNEVIPFRTAKSLASAAWEKRYLSELLPAHDGNVSKAARAAKMNRSHLSELVHRHGLASITSDTMMNDGVVNDTILGETLPED